MLNLVKVKDLAITLNVAEQTVRTWIRRKNIPTECIAIIGSTIFIIETKFYAWLENQGAINVSLSEK